MTYSFSFIPESKIPVAAAPFFQYLVDIYAGKTNKTILVRRQFADEDWTHVNHMDGSEKGSRRRSLGNLHGHPS